ncbi:MAG: hypothetical protein AB8G77_18225 [Rhodothermales bacterium]
MKRHAPLLFCSTFLMLITLSCTENQIPVIDESLRPFLEADGLVVVEAENFHSISANNTERAWYLINGEDEVALATTDHTMNASGGAYIEGLPDTRTTHDDSLIVGINFYPEAGVGPFLSYNVWFDTPGLYTVWARAYSTGTEDNGIHAGLNGAWPEAGQRMQWCDGKEQWTWASAQRVPENHCGSPGTIHIEIEKAGLHSIQFSMREDGFEFDKWLMTLDATMVPEGVGPSESVRK